jgi:hypothetical protein
MTNNFNSKKLIKFSCKICDFKCSNKQDYTRHISTRKHQLLTNTNEKTPKNSKISKEHICICGKSYKHASSLCGHKKKCNYEEKEIDNKDLNYKEMFIQMMDKNNELQQTINDMIPKIGNTTYAQNNNFNLQLFLNEDCKDALNIKDFVSSLQFQLKDLDNTGKLGFVEGTSKIFIDGLNKLEITKRPIHCSDIAEETLYIKDNDTWEKETKNKDKMKRAIDEITDANMKQMPEWVRENPTFANDEEYLKVISNIMNVMDASKQNKQKEQIINNVAKETLIDD